MTCLLGIDVGTYESKGVLVDSGGRILASAARPHPMAIPRPGWAEHDAETVWWADFVSLARELPKQAGVSGPQIAAVSTSGIAPCVLPVDAAGTPLRPAILYGVDTRASAEGKELTAALGEEWILSQTGSALSSQAAGPKILWIRRHEPDVWRRTARIHTSTSYLVHRLTGRSVMDHYTAAAYGPLYNLRARGWDPRALSLVCEASLLPELDWSAAVAGRVSPAAAAETGLAEGTVVAVGTADAASEAVAAGVLDPGDCMLMYGSTLFFVQICSGLPSSRTQWPTVYLEPGTYALAAGMSTTGALTRWFRDTFAREELAAEQGGGVNAYQALSDAASRVPPGSQGLMVLPHFSGERTPINDPEARGVIVGLTLSHGRPEIFRAILEGIAFGIRHNIEAMAEAGAAPRRLVAIGGGVRNRLWVQIVSNATGLPQTVQNTPGACYGDAVLAAISVGQLQRMSQARRWLPSGTEVRPDPAATGVYDRLYRIYRELYDGTKAVSHRLASIF